MTWSPMYTNQPKGFGEPLLKGGKTKNRRTVFNINTNGFQGAHFAVFPPELVRLCMLAGTKAGSTVLDPFFGSGTVGVVCREEHRKCVGIELNPDYVDIAVERLNKAQPMLAL